MGFVYLILEVNEGGDECYKVGISSKDPLKRKNNLKTGNPNQLSVLKQYQSENYKKIERFLHTKYSNKKTISNNEWFNLSDEDVINFYKSCKEIDDVISFMKSNNSYY